MHQHLVKHIRKTALEKDNVIHVIGVCSNPARWHSRPGIAREWIKHMLKTPNVHLTVVEGRFGDRGHELDPSDWLDELLEWLGLEGEPDEGLYDHLKINLNSEAWVKESMINIGMRSVIAKYNAQYLAWIDMDVFFRNAEWAQEALHQLQTFPVSQPYEYAHSGFAWCCTRPFYENVMGLADFPILGSADHHMAFAMIGEVDKTIHAGMQPSFFELCREWSDGRYWSTTSMTRS